MENGKLCRISAVGDCEIMMTDPAASGSWLTISYAVPDVFWPQLGSGGAYATFAGWDPKMEYFLMSILRVSSENRAASLLMRPGSARSGCHDNLANVRA